MLDVDVDVDVDVSPGVRTGYDIVALHGELDVTNAADTARILEAAVAARARVIVDLAHVTFMDCRSARELMSAQTQADQAGGALVLAGLQPIVRRLLSILDLIEPFPVLAD